ncbi:hypothetical protein Hanom_Chr03g00256391 [Helianthus anomalus]
MLSFLPLVGLLLVPGLGSGFGEGLRILALGFGEGLRILALRFGEGLRILALRFGEGLRILALGFGEGLRIPALRLGEGLRKLGVRARAGDGGCFLVVWLEESVFDATFLVSFEGDKVVFSVETGFVVACFFGWAVVVVAAFRVGVDEDVFLSFVAAFDAIRRACILQGNT